jgi:hypothetical protein
MRNFFNATEGFADGEERPEGESRTTHSAEATQFMLRLLDAKGGVRIRPQSPEVQLSGFQFKSSNPWLSTFEISFVGTARLPEQRQT